MTLRRKMNKEPLPYPDSTPMQFSGAKAFVQSDLGQAVWNELCDVCVPNKWYRLCDVAEQLETLKHYAHPKKYLSAVLKAALTDYAERPDSYHARPVKLLRSTLTQFSL